MGIKAHYLQDNDGNKFYPFSHIDATYDKNGQIVGTRLEKIETDILNRSKLDHTHNAEDVRVILEYSSKTAFPLPGTTKTIYVDKSEDELYRWSDEEFKYRKLNSFDGIKLLDGKSVKILLNMKTEEEWNSYEEYIPEYGEVCIYANSLNTKIGDGKTTIKDLEFAWFSASEIMKMVHVHSNKEILDKMTAVFTQELEANINELIAKNGEENVQGDWMETDETSDAFIKNKPINVSAFINDAEYIKQSVLDRVKADLMSDSAVKAGAALMDAKTYADSLIEKVMGGITEEKLDTINELAAAFQDNEDAITSIENALKGYAPKDEWEAHKRNEGIHVTQELKERWNEGEPNQNAYSNIAINNTSVLSSSRAMDVLNFDKGMDTDVSGIDITLTEGYDRTENVNGDINIPYDTIKIRNTRPIYSMEMIHSGVGNTINQLTLRMWKYFPLTNKKVIEKDIPITISIPPYRRNQCVINKHNDGYVITTDIVDIRGNAETATALETPRNITVKIGNDDSATQTFTGTKDISIDIEKVNIKSIYQNKDHDIIMSSSL